MKPGDRISISIPKNSATGASFDHLGLSRRRKVTVIEPRPERETILVDVRAYGEVEINRSWVRPPVRRS